MTPGTYSDYVGARAYRDNPDLQRALIDNYDARVEWYPERDEVIAVGAFWKNFINPIVIAQRSGEDRTNWPINADVGWLYGAEFDIRIGLDRISGKLTPFHFNGNLTLSESETIPDRHGTSRYGFQKDNSKSRPFPRQSPWVVNLGLFYTSEGGNLSSGVLYNSFGERLNQIGVGETPDEYEQPFHSLDYTLAYSFAGATAKFAVRNILDDELLISQEHNGKTYTTRLEETGRSIGLSISYDIF